MGAKLVVCKLLYIESSISLGPGRPQQYWSPSIQLILSCVCIERPQIQDLLVAVTELGISDMVRVTHSKKRGHCNIQTMVRVNITAYTFSKR